MTKAEFTSWIWAAIKGRLAFPVTGEVQTDWAWAVRRFSVDEGRALVTRFLREYPNHGDPKPGEFSAWAKGRSGTIAPKLGTKFPAGKDGILATFESGRHLLLGWLSDGGRQANVWAPTSSGKWHRTHLINPDAWRLDLDTIPAPKSWTDGGALSNGHAPELLLEYYALMGFDGEAAAMGAARGERGAK